MSLREAYIFLSIVVQVYISRWCERLPAALTELEAVQKQVHYFRKREALLQYPVYQQQGWPIGSGMVESANKVVVQARRVWGRHALGTSTRQSHVSLTNSWL
jgi:hypothetical protein